MRVQSASQNILLILFILSRNHFVSLSLRGSKEHSICSHAEHGNEVTLVVRTLHSIRSHAEHGNEVSGAEHGNEVWHNRSSRSCSSCPETTSCL